MNTSEILKESVKQTILTAEIQALSLQKLNLEIANRSLEEEFNKAEDLIKKKEAELNASIVSMQPAQGAPTTEVLGDNDNGELGIGRQTEAIEKVLGSSEKAAERFEDKKNGGE